MVDIVTYIKVKHISLHKIDMKWNKGYTAYKFLIPRSELNVFVDENLWPTGVSFRRFVNYNSANEQRQGDLQTGDRLDNNKVG